MAFGTACSVALAIAVTSLCWLGVVLIVTRNYATTTRTLIESNRELMRNTWAAQVSATGNGAATAGLVHAAASASQKEDPRVAAARRAMVMEASDNAMLGI